MTMYFWIDPSPKKGGQDSWHAATVIGDTQPDYEMDYDEFMEKYQGIANVVDGKLVFGKTEKQKKLEELYMQRSMAGSKKESTTSKLFDMLAEAYSVEGAQLVIFKADSKVKDEFYAALDARYEGIKKVKEIDEEIKKVEQSDGTYWVDTHAEEVKEELKK